MSLALTETATALRCDERTLRRYAGLGLLRAERGKRQDMRNELVHAYPPVSWRALHQAVETLLAELDPYKVKLAEWLEESGVLAK